MRVRSLLNIVMVLLGLSAFAVPASAATAASGGREYGTQDPSLQPVVPGTVAGLVPWLLTGWEAGTTRPPLQLFGAVLLVAGTIHTRRLPSTSRRVPGCSNPWRST